MSKALQIRITKSSGVCLKASWQNYQIIKLSEVYLRGIKPQELIKHANVKWVLVSSSILEISRENHHKFWCKIQAYLANPVKTRAYIIWNAWINTGVSVKKSCVVKSIVELHAKTAW